MCCALNPGEALRASEYRELVREMQGGEDKQVDEVKSQAGKTKGLRLVLDLHSNSVSFGSLEQDYDAFNVFIGQRTEFPILKERSIQLQPGQKLQLKNNLEVHKDLLQSLGFPSFHPLTTIFPFHSRINLHIDRSSNARIRVIRRDRTDRTTRTHMTDRTDKSERI